MILKWQWQAGRLGSRTTKIVCATLILFLSYICTVVQSLITWAIFSAEGKNSGWIADLFFSRKVIADLLSPVATSHSICVTDSKKDAWGWRTRRALVDAQPWEVIPTPLRSKQSVVRCGRVSGSNVIHEYPTQARLCSIGCLISSSNERLHCKQTFPLPTANPVRSGSRPSSKT